MATTLGSPIWGSGPAIPCRWTYDRRRSGANMQYRVYGYVNTDQATRYFGYYIDAAVSAAGSQRYSTRLKENSPSTWSSQYTFDTGWFTVSNKTSGTTPVTITLSTNAPRGASSWSYSMAVDPAGSSLSITGSRILGRQQTLALTRYSSSFTDSIRWTCGTSSGTIATKSTGTSFTFTPPISLASQNTTGTSVQIQYIVDTYSGNTLVQSQTTAITYTIPDSVIPTAEIEISDASGHLARYGAYIQGQSRLQIEITGTPAYGSPIASYAATADGTTFSGSSVTTPALQQTGQQTVSATVKDQRGRTSEAVAQNYTVMPYTTPQISKISAARCQQDGTHDPTGHYAVVDFSAEITPLNNINTADYTLKYKKTAATTWTVLALSTYDGMYSVTNGQAIFAAADDSTYDIQLLANDDFGSMHLETSIPISFALENWNLSGKGMAIGGISTKDALQIYMDTELLGGLDLGANIIPVTNGGLASTTITEAITSLLTGATEYNYTGTSTSTIQSKEYTVSGNGLVFAYCAIQNSNASGSGTSYAFVYLNGNAVAQQIDRTDAGSTAQVVASCSFMGLVSNGNTIKLEGYAQKSGNRTFKTHVVAFGCTLS